MTKGAAEGTGENPRTGGKTQGRRAEPKDGGQSPRTGGKAQGRRAEPKDGDKGRFGSYLKLCDFTLLSMTLQVELRLNKRIISETQTS